MSSKSVNDNYRSIIDNSSVMVQLVSSHVIYNHHLWLSYTITAYDHHLLSSLMTIIYNNHLWQSFTIIVYYCNMFIVQATAVSLCSCLWNTSRHSLSFSVSKMWYFLFQKWGGKFGTEFNCFWHRQFPISKLCSRNQSYKRFLHT